MTKRIVIAIICLAVLIAAAVWYMAPRRGELHPCFAYFLETEPADQTWLASYLDPVNKSAANEAATVTVKQTLGDAKTTYVVLEVRFSKDITLDDYFLQDPSILNQKGIMPISVMWGMDPSEAETAPESRMQHFATDVDFSKNTVTYLLCFDHPDNAPQKTYVLTIGAFELESEDTEAQIIQGPWTITWTAPEAPLAMKTDILSADGTTVGSVVLSPFSLSVKLLDSSDDLEELLRSIQLITPEGEVVKTHSKPSATAGDGEIRASLVFRNPVDLQSIQSVNIGKYHVSLAAP